MTFEDKIEIDNKYGISHLFFDENMSKEDYDKMVKEDARQCEVMIAFCENKKKKNPKKKKAMNILAKVFDDIFNEGDSEVDDDI